MAAGCRTTMVAGFIVLGDPLAVDRRPPQESQGSSQGSSKGWFKGWSKRALQREVVDRRLDLIYSFGGDDPQTRARRQFGGLKIVRIGTFFPPRECYPIADQSDGVLHAQINVRDDLVRGVGGCQRCQCSGNSPWCSGRCRGRWPGRRPGRCHRGRFGGSGYRHGRRDSWRSAGYSCSGCEDLHRFWPYNHGPENSRGEEVREVSTLRDLI